MTGIFRFAMQRFYSMILAGAAVFAGPTAAADFSSGGQGAHTSRADTPPGLHQPKPMTVPALASPAERAFRTSVALRRAFAARGRTKDGQDLRVPFAGVLIEQPVKTFPGPERTVWPTEGRTQVVDTTIPPYAQVGLIEIVSERGNYYYCTGMLVGPRAVLTAGHCLYNHDEGGWLKDLIFVPGLADTQTAPYGVFAYEAAYVLAGYIENYQGSYASVGEWDLGVVILGSPAGESVGWAAFGELAHEPPATAKLISFPGDKPPATMWEEACDISAGLSTPAFLAHACYIWPGASGGPILSVAGEAPRLIAVATAETPETSWAIRLTPALVAWINGIAR